MKQNINMNKLGTAIEMPIPIREQVLIKARVRYMSCKFFNYKPPFFLKV